MPLRDDARALLDEFVRQGARPYDELGVLRARRGIENAVGLQGPRVDVATHDRLVPGGDGPVPVRVYDPAPGTVSGLLVYFHGGGWVVGSVALADRPCRALAAATGCVVVSVEYRRAPETPFPGPLEDCWAATAWCAGHAGELGADPSRVAVIGDSAGGNLAAAVALLARGRGPVLSRQILLYPSVAPAGADALERYPSRTGNAEGYGLTLGEVDWYWSLYTAGASGGPVPGGAGLAGAAPILADDLTGLPPATMVTAEFDPLRDEGEAYAARLREAGVPTALHRFDGGIHGFFWFGGWLGQTAELLDLIATVTGSGVGRRYADRP